MKTLILLIGPSPYNYGINATAAVGKLRQHDERIGAPSTDALEDIHSAHVPSSSNRFPGCVSNPPARHLVIHCASLIEVPKLLPSELAHIPHSLSHGRSQNLAVRSWMT